MAASDPRPASHNTASADEADAPHAIRWSTRAVRGEPDWTGWHITDDVEFETTVCGRDLSAANGVEFSHEVERVTCRRCRKWLRGRDGEAVRDE